MQLTHIISSIIKFAHYHVFCYSKIMNLCFSHITIVSPVLKILWQCFHIMERIGQIKDDARVSSISPCCDTAGGGRSLLSLTAVIFNIYCKSYYTYHSAELKTVWLCTGEFYATLSRYGQIEGMRRIRETWPTLPTFLDAAFSTWRYVYFFKVWSHLYRKHVAVVQALLELSLKSSNKLYELS